VSDVLNRISFDRMLVFDAKLTFETYRPVHEIIMESASEREAGSSTSRVNSKLSTPSNGYRSIVYEEPSESSGRTQGFSMANDLNKEAVRLDKTNSEGLNSESTLKELGESFNRRNEPT